MALKRYLVFAFSEYYPAGGMSDFIGDYDDLEFARGKAKLALQEEDWAQIYDTEKRIEVD